LFLPLALAIGFSMVISYLLAQTFVPIMANWIMINKHEDKNYGKHHTIEEGDSWDQKKVLIEHPAHDKEGKLSKFDRFRERYMRLIDRMLPNRKIIASVYVIGALAVVVLLITTIGRDVLPKVNSGTFQVRLRAPDGTRLERTELITLNAIKILEGIVGKKNIEVTSAMVGQHPGQFSTSPIYLFMAGPQEAVLQVNLKEDYKVNLDELKEKLRAAIKKEMPTVKMSFEPIELTDKILSQGSPTPVEVVIGSKNKKQNVAYAFKVMDKLKKDPLPARCADWGSRSLILP
jgi:multidrug efflux pump subunit AcrB